MTIHRGPTYVVCSAKGPVVTGSRRVPCSICDAGVWVSPASRPGNIACFEVVLAADPDPVPVLLPPTPGQLAEIEAARHRHRSWIAP